MSKTKNTDLVPVSDRFPAAFSVALTPYNPRENLLILSPIIDTCIDLGDVYSTVWRSILIGGVIKQFFTECFFGSTGQCLPPSRIPMPSART